MYLSFGWSNSACPSSAVTPYSQTPQGELRPVHGRWNTLIFFSRRHATSFQETAKGCGVSHIPTGENPTMCNTDMGIIWFAIMPPNLVCPTCPLFALASPVLQVLEKSIPTSSLVCAALHSDTQTLHRGVTQRTGAVSIPSYKYF